MKYVAISMRVDGVKVYGPWDDTKSAHAWIQAADDIRAEVVPLLDPEDNGRPVIDVFVDKAFGAGICSWHLDELTTEGFKTLTEMANQSGPTTQLYWLSERYQDPKKLANEILKRIHDTECEPGFVGVFAECVPDGDPRDRIKFNILPLLQRMGHTKALTIKDGSVGALKLWNDHLISVGQPWPVDRIICERAIKGYYES